MIDIATIQNLFTRYGWQSHAEGSSVLTGFRGENGQFLLAAVPAENWVTLTLVDYLPKVSVERLPLIAARLIEQQGRCEFVRFALVNESQLTLVIDVPVIHGSVNYDTFAMLLDVIVFYGDDTYPRLLELVTAGIDDAQ